MTATQQQAVPTLWVELDRILMRLQRHGKSITQQDDGLGALTLSQYSEASTSLSRDESDTPNSPSDPITHLREIFGLSNFEMDILLLCAGVAIDPRFVQICSALQLASFDEVAYPTFGLAASTLDDPHWSAISRSHPLRFWRLIEIGPGAPLHAPMHIDERILQFLLGVSTMDERLEYMLHDLPTDCTHDYIHSTAWNDALRRGAFHWRKQGNDSGHLLLTGSRKADRIALFHDLCNSMSLRAFKLDCGDLPDGPAEREILARACTRELALENAALLVLTHRLEHSAALEAWLERIDAPVAVEVETGSPAEHLGGVRLQAPGMAAGESRDIWIARLGELSPKIEDNLDSIVDTFAMDPAEITQAAEVIQGELAIRDSQSTSQVVWNICRVTARRSLDDLALRIDSQVSWNDLVLPAGQLDVLRQISANARHSAIVLRRWGFAMRSGRGLGLSALFAGPSGTGKTMAASAVASELQRDLYQIDLSAMVSKYIGETEKHLRRIFEAAERSGAILLFDEADALFGKRTQVRDSHDRYANLEISYLLQRMETYRGIAILTTNMQSALDTAFQRRLRFVVQFPFPDATSRVRIWQRVFPPETPTEELDFERLSQLNITGGVIRNIALLAAFLAADERTAISMRHLLAAARTEYAKLEKPLSAAETRGWL